MKRVLVTGAGGFIGRHCCPELRSRGFEVHGVLAPPCRTFRTAEADGVIPHVVNLFDAVAVERLIRNVLPTHLLHLAWITSPGDYWTSPKNLDWVAASLMLLRAFHEAGGRRVVMAGSCAEYDWQSGFCTEEVTPIRPASLYGHAKQALHELLESFAAQTGLSAAWGRFFFLYGPHASVQRLPGAVIDPLLRGETAPCSNGECLRDYLFVTDAASAICRVLDSDLTGAVNIASGKPTHLKEMIRLCAQLIGREDLLAWGAVPSSNAAPIVVGDIRRLREELSWEPAVSLRDGLINTIDWWRTALGDNRAAA